MLIDVAIPYPVEDPFSYLVPENLKDQIKVGVRVRVPFRNRNITGYVTSVDVQKEIKNPKEILEVIDAIPLISTHHLELAKWIGEYYFSSWGEAISNMLPRISKEPKRKKKDNPETKSIDALKTEKRVLHLNEEQAKAFQIIESEIQKKSFSEILLLGVTGGGKSELYIRAIKEVLKLGKSAICLVPEIAITEQLNIFFANHFHEKLEILHSKLTDRERFEAWQRIQKGERSVILGARSAVFAPVQNLGIVIMDEEQEGSYKQDQTPRYHAREVARWRAQQANAVFLVGTATPTLETTYRAKTEIAKLLNLPFRFDRRPMPEVKIIDMKQATNMGKRSMIISTRLRDAIELAIKSKEGILLMLNRRGFSTQMKCLECGTALGCPNCAVSLTFHQSEQEAVCHYCNFHKKIPETCEKCKSPLFRFSGVGTEQVESEVARLFPNARIARLDADTTKKKGAHEKILSDFRNRQIDILVGTQMIAKGFDFQHVGLVGVVNADTGLMLPDYRASERTFQLLTQIAGRAGRGKHPGKVLVQTYSPQHYAIQHAAKHDYEGFYEEEIKNRKALRYPPFSRIINIMFRGKFEKKVCEQANELKLLLAGEAKNFEVMGPAPLPFYRLRGHFRWHVMIRGEDLPLMQSILRTALKKVKSKTGVFSAVDVEPATIL